MTSRNREVRQFAPTLSLDVFDEQTAGEYLIERAGRPDDRAGAQRLARALGYLPLALAHAAAYCATGTSFDDYLELLDALPAQELFDTSPEASYTQTVASTWKASIASAPLAGELLALAAHLDPDAIPRSLFEVVIDASVALEQKRLRDGLNALARFSLASVDDETVSVHRLLQKVVRDDAHARNDHTTATRAVAAVDSASRTSAPTCWPVCEQLLAHVLALADTSRTPAQRLIGLLNCAWLSVHHADDRRALALAQRTVATAAEIGPGQRPIVLRFDI